MQQQMLASKSAKASLISNRRAARAAGAGCGEHAHMLALQAADQHACMHACMAGFLLHVLISPAAIACANITCCVVLWQSMDGCQACVAYCLCELAQSSWLHAGASVTTMQ
jgi:hypothetical protein